MIRNKWIRETIPFPIEILEDSDGEITIATLIKRKKYPLFEGIIASGKTKEEAIKKFMEMQFSMKEYYIEKASQADRWVPIQIGDWKEIGGTWIRIYGIQFYFRHGKSMEGGFYIPFTKLNILISNYWRKNEKTN